MMYRIEFHGYGEEIIVGSCTEKMYKHFKENGIEVTDHMCGNMEDELPEEIHEGLTEETKYDNDEFYHNSAPYFNSDVIMKVFDENEVEVFSSSMEYKTDDPWNSECIEETVFSDFDSPYIMIGLEMCKGFLGEYILELKEGENFDPSKLTILFEDVDEMIEIITGLKYNDVDLECTGELSTVGKSGCWFIRDTETNEETYY
jgi:hypothetical protein